MSFLQIEITSSDELCRACKKNLSRSDHVCPKPTAVVKHRIRPTLAPSRPQQRFRPLWSRHPFTRENIKQLGVIGEENIQVQMIADLYGV